MSQLGLQPVMVGNEFIMPQQRLRVATPQISAEPATVIPINFEAPSLADESIEVTVNHPRTASRLSQFIDLAHNHALITFAFLFLLVGVAAIQAGGHYYASKINIATPASLTAAKTPTISGLNLSVPTEQLETKLQTIINQPASLTVGDQVKPISPETIKSWLQITPNKAKTEQNIHIKAATINKSLTELASKYVKTPVDQVTVTHGGVSTVVSAGKNGARLTNPATLSEQSSVLAKTLMDSKGMQFNTPLETVPFQSVTPAAFSKMIEVNVVTKQMYLYENGQITRTYPISAGAPSTPTPIGKYQIYSKLRIQDMKGFNPDGSKYFQPNVRWINYFLPGGYAVHGNYWRPVSWFGAVNSSHGCVSLPDDQAKEVYDWAPIGTTVITHT